LIPDNRFDTTFIDSRLLKNHDLDRVLLSDK
jgi:hypothetical protein